MGRAKRLPSALLSAWALAAGAAQAAGDPSLVSRRFTGQVEVLTLNQYFGAELTPLAAATSAEAFNAAVLAALRQIAANDPPARLRRQAEEIARWRPDLVGLQEVLHLECHDLPPASGACAEPSITGAFVDHLTLTLQTLRARGADYRVAARVENFGFRDITVPIPGLGTVQGVPFTVAGKNGLLVSYEQDVILARADVGTAPVTFAGCRVSAQGCNYRTSVTVPVRGVPFEVKRGYVAVDATVRGRSYRFATTHLEIREPQPGNPFSMAIQARQAAELLAALAAAPPRSDRPVIVAGDLNSSPVDQPPVPAIVPPYRQLVAAGFVDAWTARHRRRAGFTCCQDPDLRNERSKLFERIDLIFVKAQALLVEQAEVILDAPGDRTPPRPGRPRLWPSDHAGVVTLLRFWN